MRTATCPAASMIPPGPIEAESVQAIDEKYQQNTDPEFRARCLIIKEQRSELVKHHLWVLWTDYFKPPHFEKYPQLPAGEVGQPHVVDLPGAHRIVQEAQR